MKTNQLINQFGARNRRLREHGLTYQEFLNSDRWKELKANLSQKEEFKKCWICGSQKYLQLHHRSYTKMFEPIKKAKRHIIALCSNCHQTVHDVARQKNWGLGQTARNLRRKFLAKQKPPIAEWKYREKMLRSRKNVAIMSS